MRTFVPACLTLPAMMMKFATLLVTLGLPLTVSGNTLYKCQGPDGRMTYTNQKSHQKCEIIAQDKPVSTFSAPPPRSAKQPTPADFPRVTNDQQEKRDNDRRAILEQELANEQKNLDAARKELSEQENLVMPDERIAGGGIQGGKRETRVQLFRDKVQLHERNIESIRREITKLK
ncbi:hypothetical protein MASR1M60_28200 [Rhodocyclaceae bacterium]